MNNKNANNTFSIDEVIYDLSHLDPFYTEFIQPANQKNPERLYRCLIEFSCHCFTKSPNIHKGETLSDYPNNLHYQTEKEVRIFDLIRYELSKQLPHFLRKMDQYKCYFTSADDKFLTISIQDNNGEQSDYEIYFSLRKSKRCDVHIFINSAYLKDKHYKNSAEKPIRRKPISFFVLLKNTIENKKIKRPK